MAFYRLPVKLHFTGALLGSLHAPSPIPAKGRGRPDPEHGPQELERESSVPIDSRWARNVPAQRASAALIHNFRMKAPALPDRSPRVLRSVQRHAMARASGSVHCEAGFSTSKGGTLRGVP